MKCLLPIFVNEAGWGWAYFVGQTNVDENATNLAWGWLHQENYQFSVDGPTIIHRNWMVLPL